MTLRRTLGVALAALLGSLFAVGPATAATTGHTRETLHGVTSVTTAPGIAPTLIGAGILPLPVGPTRFRVTLGHGLAVTYGFPVTGGDPDLSGPSGDITHSGGIDFVSLNGRQLEIGHFDISLSTAKIYATQVNFKPARIAVLDLDLTRLVVSHHGDSTVLSGIVLRLDPAAAQALNATFALALPTNGSLTFASATVTLRS